MFHIKRFRLCFEMLFTGLLDFNGQGPGIPARRMIRAFFCTLCFDISKSTYP